MTTGKQRRNMASSIYANVQAIPGLTTAQLNVLTGVPISGISQSGNVTYNYGNGQSALNTLMFDKYSHRMHSDVKKYEIYESPVDLLALSIAFRRIRTVEGKMDISSVLDKYVVETVSVEDKDLANTIRDYYSKKIMMWKLKGKSLTRFRNDMNEFVHSDGIKFKEEMIGLAYYLPNFYDYDIQFDDVCKEINYRVNLSSVRILPSDARSLTPLKKISKFTKKFKTQQYWLKDNETQGMVLIGLETRNPLEHIWDNIFQNSTELKVKGKYYLKEFSDIEYFSIKDWTLAKT
jgi:hypothetical protein